MMSDLKAWQINDVETWSGRDVGEAIAAAMKATGLPRDEVADEEGEIEEVSRDLTVREDEETDELTTVGAILDAMTEPGLVCATEW